MTLAWMCSHLDIYHFSRSPRDQYIQSLLPPNYRDSTGELHGRSEVRDMIVQFVEVAEHLLSDNQSLVALIKECLHNTAAQQPHTGELLTRLHKMMTHSE